MSLSEGDKAIVRDIAFEVAKVMKQETKDCITTAIAAHVVSCVVGKKVSRVVWMVAGAVVILGILGVTTLPGVGELLKRLANGN